MDAKNLSVKTWGNGWKIYQTGSSIPSEHSHLGCVARTRDGRYGFVCTISNNSDKVSIGNGLDFGLWQSESFSRSDVRVVGLVAIPDKNGDYHPQRI